MNSYKFGFNFKKIMDRYIKLFHKQKKTKMFVRMKKSVHNFVMGLPNFQ
jgi:hypothetical protein